MGLAPRLLKCLNHCYIQYNKKYTKGKITARNKTFPDWNGGCHFSSTSKHLINRIISR